MYESDLTKFMREYLAQHPEEVESQKIGRAAWWDKDPAGVAPPPAHVRGPLPLGLGKV